MARVTITGSNSFSVTTDMNQNGRLDLPAETQTLTFNGANQVAMTGSGVSLPVTVRFDERGRAILTDCVSSPPPSVPLLYFCDVSCASINDQNANAIYVSPTGTVSMLTGNIDTNLCRSYGQQRQFEYDRQSPANGMAAGDAYTHAHAGGYTLTNARGDASQP